MAILSEIVHNVIVIVMVASFLEILLPSGRIKPFVRFAIGLFVIIAVLNPTLSLLFGNKNFSVNMWDYKMGTCGSEDVLEQGLELHQKITEKNLELVKDKLQGQIEAIVMLVPEVRNAQAEVDMGEGGLVNKVNLKVTAELQPVMDASSMQLPLTTSLEQDTSTLEKKINGVLNNIYGLEGVGIILEFEGGG